ncbi:hypothetical protein H312_01095 [Anncaliia algerae PRA339]|uniref:ISXO2-like transposase domain-containing protein n=1 Tax=Anncaliia algerae PRA339 TaxID=1288291 RepID=A0A059F350_9MICR|nr:hypothetical protein H312_01095 [Anncaliia algerae PRA339]
MCDIFNFHNNKLDGVNKIFQIDETILNLRCKSHQGRYPHNKTDALVMVEFEDKIKRVFAGVIP